MATTANEVRRFGRDIRLPLDPDSALPITPTGDLQLLEGLPALDADLRRRLLASEGELVHRPDWGGGLLDKLEATVSPATLSAVQTRARRNLLDDPRVSEVKVAVRRGTPDDADAEAFTVELAVRPRGDDEDLTFAFAVE